MNSNLSLRNNINFNRNNSNRTKSVGKNEEFSLDFGRNLTNPSNNLNGSAVMNLNGEDFLLMPANGNSLNFKPVNANKSNSFFAYRNRQESSDEMSSSIFSLLMGTIFSGFHLMEAMSHLSEITNKLTEDNSYGFKLNKVLKNAFSNKFISDPSREFVNEANNSKLDVRPTKSFMQKMMESDREDARKKKFKKTKGI